MVVVIALCSLREMAALRNLAPGQRAPFREKQLELGIRDLKQLCYHIAILALHSILWKTSATARHTE